MVLKQIFGKWLLGSGSPPLPPHSMERHDLRPSSPAMNSDCLFEGPIALAAAVADFNLRATQDEVGKAQTPLTVDEVVTAIRSAGRHQLPLIEYQRRMMHTVAETQQLPAYSGLKFTTTWFSPSGYRCEVWWVELVLCSQEQQHDERLAAACSLRIRDHRLRSWRDSSVTVPREIQRLQADQRWFTPQPPRADLPSTSAPAEATDRIMHM